MAITWPAKNNFATGDVLTATQMNNIGDDLNDLDTRVTAAGGFWKNPVLNSNFSVWQRGTSFASAANVYTADRWLVYRNAGNLTTSRVTTSDTTNLPFIQYAAQLQRTASSTTTDTVYYINQFESVNSIPFAGKQVTLSFYARCGTNFSPTSSQINAKIDTGTGTDQNYISGYTGQATALSGNVTLTTTWQRFSITGTIASTATELAIVFNYVPTGTAGANDWAQFTGVQLQVGSSATAYYPNGNTYQAELAACQRYYERTYITSATESAPVGTYSDANYVGGVQWKVVKRSTPTLTVYSTNGGTAGNVRQTSTNTNYPIAGTAGLTVYGVMVLTGVGRSNMVDWHYEVSSEL